MSQATAEQIENLEVYGTGDMIAWLTQNQCSIVFSSFKPGKLFSIGLDAAGALSVFHRTFDYCTGLTLDAKQNLYVASLYQIWKLTNILPKGQWYQDFDRLYCPQQSYITGEINAHDMAVDPLGRLLFVNSAFNCIAIASPDYSFEVLWKPNFIKRIVAEDHCHLNGFAMDHGRPRFVSMFSTDNENDGWRKNRFNSGTIMDVDTYEIVCSGLCMPHSPRLYQGKLYVLNSGKGEFGYIDLKSGQFEVMTFCPGFARGLSFVGNYAIVGLSKVKEKTEEDPIPLFGLLKQHGFEESQCGFCIIDLNTGKIVHSLEFCSPIVNFVYDVVPLLHVKKPLTLGTEQDHIRRAIALPPSHYHEQGEFMILDTIRELYTDHHPA